VALLHVLGTGPAHLVGISMGGALAQLVAADRPERVASLTLISTSPGGAGLPPSALPPLPPEPDWSDREAVVDYEVALARAFAGGYGVDEPRVSARAERVIDRSVDIAASRNHWNLDGGPDLRSRLSAIAAPTLVIHGTDDPLFPLAHGEALAREIPGADLFVLEKVGHEVPPRPVWDMVVAAILRHTA
jgi:pimeloyl-ACP methyl ester carboxylesterase